jgi:hypothetical protein
MLSRIDDIIYPNRCEVIELASQRYIYPIYKNGSGSITEYAKLSQYKTLFNEQIRRVELINVILRDPLSRFISGVNTYVFNTKRDNPNLDVSTILYFVEHYLFLNRHYAPQFFWLLNLARFSRPDTLVTFSPMTEIGQLTDRHSRANVEPITDKLKEKIESFDWSKLDLYLQLDQILLDHIGQTTTMHDLITHIQLDHKKLYELVFQPTLNIADVLS